jgi:hypothetical protein
MKIYSRLLTLFLTLCCFSWGAINPEKSVVKVTSQYGPNKEISNNGSGLLFQNQGKTWVLTSEHVVWHTYQNVENRVYLFSEKPSSYKAELKTVDWAVGIALLEVLNYAGAALPTLDDFKKGLPEKGDQLYVSGFRSSGVDLILDPNGNALLPEGHEHLFPDIKTVIQIKGALADEGMSGGPVFSMDRNEIVGILSHRYLELVHDNNSPVSDYKRGSRLETLPICIPSPFLYKWLQKYFSDPRAFKPSFVRDIESQQAKEESILSGGLKFKLLSKTPHKKAGDPIGGGDGVGELKNKNSKVEPVGGGDGVGSTFSPSNVAHIIGGTTQLIDCSKDPRASKIEISYKEGDIQTRGDLSSVQSWIGAVRPLSKKHVTIIPFLVEEHGDYIRKICFSSLARFFHELSRPGFEPGLNVYAITQKDGSKNTVREERLKKWSNAISGSITSLEKAKLPLESKLLLHSSKLVSEILDSSDWMILKQINLLKRVTETEKDGQRPWASLFQADYDSALELLTNLSAVKENLRW